MTCLDTQQHDPSSWYSWMGSLYSVERQYALEGALKAPFASALAWLVALRTTRHSTHISQACLARDLRRSVRCITPVFFFLRCPATILRESFCAIMAESGMARQNLVVGVSTALTAISCKLIIHCVLS
jgi:hypothetical protein